MKKRNFLFQQYWQERFWLQHAEVRVRRRGQNSGEVTPQYETETQAETEAVKTTQETAAETVSETKAQTGETLHRRHLQ